MSSMQRAMPLTIVVLLLHVLLLSSVPAQVASHQAGPIESGHEPSTDASYSYHKMTSEEMSDLRERFGSRDDSRDYNVIVGGHGTGLSPPSAESWLSMVGSVNTLESVEADLSSVPTSLDLSSEPTFPAVGDQASQPSCAAWAATYYAYGFAEATDLGWNDAKAGDPSQLLSPGWTYSKVNGGRDSGSSMDENMFVIRDWGAATLATMPYDDSVYLDWGSPSAFREAPEHRAEEVFYIPYSGPATVDDIKVLVSEGTLVTFGLDANQYLPGFADDNFILSSAEYSSNTLNHAQTIVGFDDSIADDGEVGAFRVVNSWGSGWGEAGFYWFTYDALLELGMMDALYLNYITDVPDYSPELLAVWHFNAAPSRSADIEVGIGPASSAYASKIPYFVQDRSASHQYPTYMCLDITELSEEYATSDVSFFLDIGPSPSKGTISSFKIEHHAGDFVPGCASRTSSQSADVPRTTPASVAVSLPRYDPIALDDALDASSLSVVLMSEVQWVGVDHESIVDGDSMQSGDVGDGETTTLALSIVGPMDLSFWWKVSSEPGGDVLSFEIPEAGIDESITGDQDWSERDYEIGEGAHTLVWSYSKDSSASELDDTAWLDSVTMRALPVDFSLEASYTTICGQELTVTPMEIFNPMSSELSFWYDWGDESPMVPGDPGSAYSASHVYGYPGGYEVTVSMEDEYSNNISRAAEVRVSDANQRPVVHSLSISPGADYYEPLSVVRFDVGVSDLEGDTVTVSIVIPAAGALMERTMALDSDTVVVISFDYECPEGSEAPYEVMTFASDDAEHLLSGDWDSDTIALLVNSPPTASVTAIGSVFATGEEVTFDASASYDAETPSEGLEVRWDWESDGEWDTDWSGDMSASRCYLIPGAYDVTAEVRDTNGLTSTSTTEVTVTGEPIPEFSVMLVPVIAVLILFVFAMRFRRAEAR
jgi:C1A family cysteine protease/PKD repeat protein